MYCTTSLMLLSLHAFVCLIYIPLICDFRMLRSFTSHSSPFFVLSFFLLFFFFFFSSRRRHTRYWRDWSSDVCSSDLVVNVVQRRLPELQGDRPAQHRCCSLDDVYDAKRVAQHLQFPHYVVNFERSEERRVGKECRSRWSPYH